MWHCANHTDLRRLHRAQVPGEGLVFETSEEFLLECLLDLSKMSA